MHLERVSYRYQRRGPWVLQDVTLSLPAAQVTEVTGPNGAGKSTFLRLLAGLRIPRRGTITGRPAKVGYAPERFPADQPFTVQAYLSHMAAIQKAPRTAITTWAEHLGFDHLLTTRLPDLSKGSAQKVGLAQALLSTPDLLILDEPFAGLDSTTRALLPPLITDLATQGTTIVVSDHQRCLSPLPDLTTIHINHNKAQPTPPTNHPSAEEPPTHHPSKSPTEAKEQHPPVTASNISSTTSPNHHLRPERPNQPAQHRHGRLAQLDRARRHWIGWLDGARWHWDGRLGRARRRWDGRLGWLGWAGC